MTTTAFDAISRRAASAATRRSALRALGGAALLAWTGAGEETEAKKKRRKKRGHEAIGQSCTRSRQCRSGKCFQLLGICARKGCIGEGECNLDSECCSGVCGGASGCDNV